MAYILIAALAFGLCYALDKLFQRLFRSKALHKSGLSVHLHRYYALGGILLVILGLAGFFTGINGKDTVFWIGSLLVVLLGGALLAYYLTCGIYYDAETFLYTTFGKKGRTYSYQEIRGQQLYASGRTTIIELYLADGRSVFLQSTMAGVYPFLDQAFAGWCRQRGLDPDACDFHDPDKSLWFPKMEDQ